MSSLSTGPAVAVFVVGAVVSLATSWVFVIRLERLGERLGLSEALLGLLAAFGADAPEITSAITALTHHQAEVGSGVVIGSNVFNLAALLGLGAVVAGRIGLHRKVVLLGGAVATWVAAVCVLSVVGVFGPVVGLVLVLGVIVPYGLLLGTRHSRIRRLALPARWAEWLAVAVAEEEDELAVAIRPRPGTGRDAVVAVVALGVVVGSSVLMERSATSLGRHFDVAGIVVGGLVLAVVTSLPNAVAGVYLAARGRGAAMLSTTWGSNMFNVVLGLLLPAAVIGLGKPSGQAILVVGAYGVLTVATVVLAYCRRGLDRLGGSIVIAVYVGFALVLVAIS